VLILALLAGVLAVFVSGTPSGLIVLATVDWIAYTIIKS